MATPIDFTATLSYINFLNHSQEVSLLFSYSCCLGVVFYCGKRHIPEPGDMPYHRRACNRTWLHALALRSAVRSVCDAKGQLHSVVGSVPRPCCDVRLVERSVQVSPVLEMVIVASKCSERLPPSTTVSLFRQVAHPQRRTKRDCRPGGSLF